MIYLIWFLVLCELERSWLKETPKPTPKTYKPGEKCKAYLSAPCKAYLSAPPYPGHSLPPLGYSGLWDPVK